MEEKNQRNSKRRLNSLILLVAFTAIMLIVSTYAWFSAQKNVSITGLRGKVNVAEGLQVSLDAKNWSGSLDLSELDIITDAYKDVVINPDTQEKVSNTNFKTTELLPVSTTGKVATGTLVELPMYRGENSETVKLDKIVATQTTVDGTPTGTPTTAAANPDIYPGYFAFDIFLQNSGITTGDKQDETTEVLQLNTDSTVTVLKSGENYTDGYGEGNPNVGLQNTVRVAFAEFSGFAPVTASQEEILAKTNAATSKITDVAIWEPNAAAHVDNIVQNNNLIKWPAGLSDKYLGTDSDGKFTKTDRVPTFALTDESIKAGSNSIADIYNWQEDAPDAAKMALQNVFSTETVSHGGKVMNLKSAADGTTNFEILKNTVVKLRVYVWLEGQDVDCTNYASHGGGIEVDIGLIKSVDAAELGS